MDLLTGVILFVLGGGFFYLLNESKKARQDKKLEELNETYKKQQEKVNKLSDDIRTNIGKYRKLRANRNKPPK